MQDSVQIALRRLEELNEEAVRLEEFLQFANSLLENVETSHTAITAPQPADNQLAETAPNAELRRKSVIGDQRDASRDGGWLSRFASV